jgi:FkbM family methyltransferase
MTAMRAVGALGTAARVVRRVGLGRVLRGSIDLTDRALVSAGVPPLAAEVDGVEFRGFLRHRGFLEYIQQGMPDERLYRSLLLGALDERTTFVDAGAHIGVYTVFGSDPARRVVAFEPDPYNFAALRRNVKAAGCTNVEIRPEAVADRPGRAPFRAFRSTFSGSLLPREVDEYRDLETDVVRLDDVLTDADLDDLVVKLDVEGAEPLALSGMQRILREARLLLLVLEVNPEALEAGGSSPQKLMDELVAADLECLYVHEDRQVLRPVPARGSLEKGNVACWRQRDSKTFLRSSKVTIDRQRTRP